MSPETVGRSSPATGLIGRERERERVRELIEGGARLVTLTGPGGTGKTRLALALVHDLRERYANGAAVVELAPLREPSIVPAAIAQVVGLRESAGAEIDEALAAFLASRELLLGLDNFEHLLDAAPLVSRLLTAAPGLTVIATSRAPLRLRDEQELPVPPLPPSDAEALFVRRAGQVRPDLELDDGDRDAVSEICRRLDGLPLAIELAAARIRALPPRALLERLHERLPLLTGGPRDAPERQRTLRATIEWSYELLPARERELFAHLSVFAGGCTPQAAEAVCEADLDAVAALVEHSLLRRMEAGGAARYTMLETIREYAAERLGESSVEADVRGRHGEFFLALAGTAAGSIYGGGQREWLDRLDVELPNIRGALALFIQRGQAAEALRLCTAIWTFWEARRPSDGRRWLEAGLAAGDSVPAAIRARAMIAYGHLMLFAGEHRLTREVLETAAELCRELGDAEGLTLALSHLSWVALEQGRPADADSLAEEGLGLLSAVEEPWVRAEALNYLGTTVAESDAIRGAELLEQAHSRWTDLGNVQRAADVLNNLGWTTMLTGEYERSRAYHEENLRVARRNDDSFRKLLALGNLGLVELLDGHPDRVPPLLAEELPLILERGDRRVLPEAAVVAGSVAGASGDAIRAARLAGAAEAVYEAGGGTWSQPEQHLLDRYILPLREESAERFDGAWAEGRLLSFEEAVAYALEDVSGVGPAAEPVRPDDGGLAGYELEAVVGRGGMGVVWRARQPSLDRLVAVKLIASEQAGSAAFRERFLREARLAASLENPHVLPVYEAGETEGRLFLAMRYVEGEDLATLLAREGPLQPARAVALLAQVASALDAAHARGLVHRDVKPANVLLVSQEDGEHAYLTDFGIAKATASETAGLTEAGQLLGTVDYLAPETIQRGEATPAADVYALACLLHELLTGTTPFARDSDVATIWAHVQEPPPPLPHTNPALPALDPVLQRGLAKDPAQRYQRASHLAAAARQALAGELPWAPPAPAAVEAWPEGLPRPPAALVGRSRELADLVALLGPAGSQLVTITGPGGTGKTRLALELAARAASRFEDGVHFVALAPIREPSLVASTIAQTIGLRESGARAPEELLEQRLREGELLVLIDNAEHLLPAASPLLARLAGAAGRSRIVVTSRAALGVTGEQGYPLEPLQAGEAADLFEARARAVKPSLELDAEAAAVVASICARLDGLPLAIELAAARIRLLSPQAILKRLNERLALLTGGPADAPARQQTLRATIDWSYELLEPEEQRLFAELSVFPGGARLETLEAICGGDLDVLDALVRRSLVVVTDDPDREPRFWMLETIREYAADQLEFSGDAGDVRRALAAHMLQLVEQADLRGRDHLYWLERLDAEHDNIRAALTWALEHDEPGAARFGAKMWEFWWARGHFREGRDRLGQVISATGEQTLEHAIATLGDAVLARDLGDEQEGHRLCRGVVPVFEVIGERKWLAEALDVLGTFEATHDPAAGKRLINRAIAIAREAHDDYALAHALVNLGWVTIMQGQPAEALGCLEESLDAWTRIGNVWGLAIAEGNLGWAHLSLGDVPRADEFLKRSLVTFARLGMPWLVCATVDELAIGVARGRGDDVRAGQLLGARDGLAESLGVVMAWVTDDAVEQAIRDSLGVEAFDAAYADGRAMSLEEAVDSAVGLDHADEEHAERKA